MNSHEKILTTIMRNKPQEWFYAYDVIGEGELFVGYEATARLSELVNDTGTMFESIKDGKYLKRRIRWEDKEKWLPFINNKYRAIIIAESRRYVRAR